ncbi:MAG: putative bifunctional diguanylate cyclase/phosphodiesterase [Pseudomonadota bacterium]
MKLALPNLQEVGALLNAMPGAVFIKNRNGQILLINDTACALFGHSRDTLLHCDPHDFLPTDAADLIAAVDAHVLDTGEDFQYEEEIVREDGEPRRFLTTKRRIRIEDEPYLVCVATDITELRAAEARTHYLAFHDALTGLPNRALLNERIDQALLRARRQPENTALVYVDLDRFKEVNDSLGHAAGDALITAFASRLSGLARASDTVARLGGDEFAVLLTDVGQGFDPNAFCRRALESAMEPFDLPEGQAIVAASIGVAVLPPDEIERDELHRRADVALYEAKNSGRGCYRVFSTLLDERTRRRRRIEMDLRAALARGDELEVFYQPVVASGSDTLRAMEALVRWRHPELGMLTPVEFVPIAEETGLIVPLGEWVLERSAAMMAAWPDVSIAVNISPVQLRADNVVDRVLEIVAKHGLAPGQLQLEVTETAIFDADAHVSDKLKRLRAAGVKIVLDDFGTGYSSLAHLQQIEVDRVKIDQSFVARLSGSEDSRAIIQAVLSIGHTLGIRVTAEGVETAAQRDFLKAFGCDELQGYLFSRPLDEAAARAYLARDAKAQAA